MEWKRLFLFTVSGLLVLSCGGGGDSSTGTTESERILTVVFDTTTSTAPVLTQAQQAVVDVHNQKRQGYYLDADISYSHVLEEAAQQYADTLAQSGAFIHDPNNQSLGYGENLYAHSANKIPDLNTVLNSWFDDEEPFYNYSDGSCNEGTFANGQSATCGHYTQVLWQETREVGCASSQYQVGEYQGGYVYVCKYQKAGNVQGEKPYCLEYSNADLYTEKSSSFLQLSLAGRSFPIELMVEDRSKCTRTSSMNSSLTFGSTLQSVVIKEFKIFNTDTALVTLDFDKLVVRDREMMLTGKNRHISDENYQDKDIYMKITLLGETDTYYSVALDWNGYDASQTQYSRQMKAKLHKQ
ncbi:MAG TPA: hypothetical protein ENK86_04020 [Campylobacterales bacterium]|nr:hypothetical protein [Campylobacterales bacterium]